MVIWITLAILAYIFIGACTWQACISVDKATGDWDANYSEVDEAYIMAGIFWPLFYIFIILFALLPWLFKKPLKLVDHIVRELINPRENI